jgi:hypothetical protein
MGVKIKSTVTPEPQTFNEWQAHLQRERNKIWLAKIGRNDDLIDIERDND